MDPRDEVGAEDTRRCATDDCCRLLITGPSGSGKSYFASALASMGYPAFDSDTVPGLAGWRDRLGRRVEPPGQLDADFLREHRYLWEDRVLTSFLGSRPVTLLFGISHNSQQLAFRFDWVFLLTLPVERLLRNLRSKGRANAFGRTAEHRAMAKADTAAYYRSVPAEWTKLAPGTPAELIDEVQRALNYPFANLDLHR